MGFSFIKEVDDGPGIVDVPPFPKGKPVIPVLHQLPLSGQAVFLQGLRYFLLRKAKAVRIFFGGSGHHLGIIEVGKNRLLADSSDPGENSPLQVRVGLEGGVEQAADKGDHFLPVTVHVGLLHGSVILVQEDNDFLAIIPAQIIG